MKFLSLLVHILFWCNTEIAFEVDNPEASNLPNVLRALDHNRGTIYNPLSYLYAQARSEASRENPF